MITDLLIASNNPDKISELKALLASLPLKLHGLRDFPQLTATEEDQDTIAGNAMKKALEAAQGSGLICLADDTGLFINALNNAPGVYAARFAGENCSYADNRRKVLQLMQGIEDRRAEFRTAVALASPEGIITVVEGKVEGVITHEERGNSGFGYDSIFAVKGTTYAEMEEAAKNGCSHRAEAIKAILPILAMILE
jgi:XTP/dITP diphosphohydrolase